MINPIANLLKTDAILFWSSYGSKAVAESWTQRLNKQIKSVEQKFLFLKIVMSYLTEHTLIAAQISSFNSIKY